MEDHLDQRKKCHFFFRQNHLFVRSHVVDSPERQTQIRNIFQHSQQSRIDEDLCLQVWHHLTFRTSTIKSLIQDSPS